MRLRYEEPHHGALCSCEPWYDGKHVYLAIDEYEPGGIVGHPKRHRAFLIDRTSENEMWFDERFDSIVHHIVWVGVPSSFNCIVDTKSESKPAQKKKKKKKFVPRRRKIVADD